MRGKLVVGGAILSAAGLAFISGNEGRVLKAYPDPVGVVTICDGHTKTAKMGQVATNAMCDELLKQDVREAEAAVQRLVTATVTQEQYIALVDFTYNKGQGNLASSTLLKKVNLGQCYAAGDEFLKWRYAKGYELRGLVIRGQRQRELWVSGC